MPDMATIPFLQVDSFTHEPFGGNPAAVCLLESEPVSYTHLRAHET